MTSDFLFLTSYFCLLTSYFLLLTFPKEVSMTTPIYDFCKNYANSHTIRFHMPGHKGVPLLGVEPYDITEIAGADSLYEADGIIAESEHNASTLFGVPTFYSTEGSSQCIRAMLYLLTHEPTQWFGGKATILAGRNAHKTFVTACGLLDIHVHWLWGTGDNYLSCNVTPDEVENAITSLPHKPTAVYLTSPDYLGNMVDTRSIAQVCHKHGVYLAVDCAHGAYLHFLPTTCHPMDEGADLCCASAHKTLPALTGCAYLHLSPTLPDTFHQNAKDALALFGSTSPSYLLLCSLDRVNLYLESGYREALSSHIEAVENCRLSLTALGYECQGDASTHCFEPMKLTLCPKFYGYTGVELAEYLRKNHIECEFADPDHVVLMTVPGQENALTKLPEVLRHLPRRTPNPKKAPPLARKPIVRESIREALFSPCETIPVEDAVGRVLSALTVGCPPAVPIVVCGEEITAETVEVMRYYGMDTVKVRNK